MRTLAPWCRGSFVLACLVALAGNLVGQDKDKPKKAEAKTATVIVKCIPDAVLTIDGEKSTQTGATRKFLTPPLTPGPKYYYTISALWEPNNYTKITRKRKVYVKPGETVTVDLTKADAKFPDDILVRYVPTPQVVVDAMLKMGKVGKGDVVFDLGCGDGRIPVTAVSKFNAKRGVGIDIDPERIKESKANAKDAKVEDKVEFRQQDVLKIKDISDATVVTLYMGEDLNRQLRPILEKTLKNGTRIVSHRFMLGDWKPERSETIDVSGVPYRIHLWTIKKDTPKKDKDDEDTPKKDDKKDKKDKDDDKKDKKDKKDKDDDKDTPKKDDKKDDKKDKKDKKDKDDDKDTPKKDKKDKDDDKDPPKKDGKKDNKKDKKDKKDDDD